MVEHVLAGYNACVFAYGQTGSGKSYTMGTNRTSARLEPEVGFWHLACECYLQHSINHKLFLHINLV